MLSWSPAHRSPNRQYRNVSGSFCLEAVWSLHLSLNLKCIYITTIVFARLPKAYPIIFRRLILARLSWPSSCASFWPRRWNFTKKGPNACPSTSSNPTTSYARKFSARFTFAAPPVYSGSPRCRRPSQEINLEPKQVSIPGLVQVGSCSLFYHQFWVYMRLSAQLKLSLIAFPFYCSNRYQLKFKCWLLGKMAILPNLCKSFFFNFLKMVMVVIDLYC